MNDRGGMPYTYRHNIFIINIQVLMIKSQEKSWTKK